MTKLFFFLYLVLPDYRDYAKNDLWYFKRLDIMILDSNALDVILPTYFDILTDHRHILLLMLSEISKWINFCSLEIIITLLRDLSICLL